MADSNYRYGKVHNSHTELYVYVEYDINYIIKDATSNEQNSYF